jgi:hypothetical protein
VGEEGRWKEEKEGEKKQKGKGKREKGKKRKEKRERERESCQRDSRRQSATCALRGFGWGRTTLIIPAQVRWPSP